MIETLPDGTILYYINDNQYYEGINDYLNTLKKRHEDEFFFPFSTNGDNIIWKKKEPELEDLQDYINESELSELYELKNCE